MMKTTTGSPLADKARAEAGVAVILLRLALGWIFFYEGSGKLFGWFDGSGIEGIARYFQGLGIPFPHFNAYFVGWAEFIAGFCFVLGFLAKFAALTIAIIMAVAIFTAHRQGGFNYPLLIIAATMVLLQYGAGKFSLDRLFRVDK